MKDGDAVPLRGKLERRRLFASRAIVRFKGAFQCEASGDDRTSVLGVEAAVRGAGQVGANGSEGGGEAVVVVS